VGGLVDFFYSLKMKNVDFNSERSVRLGRICGIISIILVAGIIVWAFMIMGSPATQRNQRLDQKRIDDLNNIQSQIINFYQQKGNLPAALTDLNNSISGYSLPVDPEFTKGNVYKYEPTGVLSFQLCAIFTSDSPIVPNNTVRVEGPIIPVSSPKTTVAIGVSPNGVVDSWAHNKGDTCFIRVIDPILYPVIKK
jgi:hypothetical protein